jgi:hypothetical protein
VQKRIGIVAEKKQGIQQKDEMYRVPSQDMRCGGRRGSVGTV